MRDGLSKKWNPLKKSEIFEEGWTLENLATKVKKDERKLSIGCVSCINEWHDVPQTCTTLEEERYGFSRQGRWHRLLRIRTKLKASTCWWLSFGRYPSDQKVIGLRKLGRRVQICHQTTDHMHCNRHHGLAMFMNHDFKDDRHQFL
ncbi:unnamed protein product [Dovyalis caffra]|uniref:Uncharacterized protein n=1 Tax=Dovyalis caffra TaxID=77055 RepID=A0AAV1R662_9ROSI|nr:unnamed protein product [Dovyalis caffra]